MDQLLKVSEPYIISMNVLFLLNQVLFNSMETNNIKTNTNGEEVTISPRCYTIGEIIAILNTMTHTTFSISMMASRYGYVSI